MLSLKLHFQWHLTREEWLLSNDLDVPWLKTDWKNKSYSRKDIGNSLQRLSIIISKAEIAFKTFTTEIYKNWGF